MPRRTVKLAAASATTLDLTTTLIGHACKAAAEFRYGALLGNALVAGNPVGRFDLAG